LLGGAETLKRPEKCSIIDGQEHQASLETIIQQFGDVLTTEDVFARLDGGSSLQV
jgi:hypothetical protein